MVQTRRNLADLLADDMGNLRPEAVEILRTMRPQRVRPRQVHENWRRVRPWLVAIFILVLSVFTMADVLKEDGHKSQLSAANYDSSEEKKRIANRRSYPKVHLQGNQWTGHRSAGVKARRNFMKKKEQNAVSAASQAPEAFAKAGEQLSPEKRDNAKFIRPVPNQALGKAAVFGFDVNIRRAPRLGSHIVRQADQGEVFLAISFVRGWFEIVLNNGRPAYIFGAYLLPLDFRLASHSVGLDRNKTKLLLAEDQDPDMFRVIRPDGSRHYIRKSDVRIVN